MSLVGDGSPEISYMSLVGDDSPEISNVFPRAATFYKIYTRKTKVKAQYWLHFLGAIVNVIG